MLCCALLPFHHRVVTFSEALRSFARILRGAHELAASDNSESYESSNASFLSGQSYRRHDDSCSNHTSESKITISTVAPDPSAFATLGSAPAALAWSVHAVDDSLRRQLVPTTKVSTTEWNGKHTSQPNSFVFLIRDTYSVLNGGTTSWTCESTVVEIKQTA